MMVNMMVCATVVLMVVSVVKKHPHVLSWSWWLIWWYIWLLYWWLYQLWKYIYLSTHLNISYAWLSILSNSIFMAKLAPLTAVKWILKAFISDLYTSLLTLLKSSILFSISSIVLLFLSNWSLSCSILQTPAGNCKIPCGKEPPVAIFFKIQSKQHAMLPNSHDELCDGWYDSWFNSSSFLQIPLLFTNMGTKSPGNWSRSCKKNILKLVWNSPNNGTVVSHVSDLPTHSPNDQFQLLSSISNFHKFGYPSINIPKYIVSPNYITYRQHSLCDPYAKENPNGYFISEHLPTSPRNRLMYFIFNEKTWITWISEVPC